MTTIFTLMVCLYFPNPAEARYNGCSPPDNGLTFYQSENECRTMADYYTRIDADPRNSGGAVKQEWKCFKRSIDVWEPAS